MTNSISHKQYFQKFRSQYNISQNKNSRKSNSKEYDKQKTRTRLGRKKMTPSGKNRGKPKLQNYCRK